MLYENPLLSLIFLKSAFNLTKAGCRYGCWVCVCVSVCVRFCFFKKACLLSPAVEQRFVECAVRTPVKSNANLSPETSQMALVFFPHSLCFLLRAPVICLKCSITWQWQCGIKTAAAVNECKHSLRAFKQRPPRLGPRFQGAAHAVCTECVYGAPFILRSVYLAHALIYQDESL